MLFVAWTAPAVLAKPLCPLQGDFQPREVQAKPGVKIAVDLVIEPLEDFSKVSLTATVPDNIQLLEGPVTMELRDLRAGQKKTLHYILRVTAEGEQRFWVYLKPIDFKKGVVINKGYLLIVNPVAPAEYETKTDDQGHDFIEIEMDE